MTDTRETRYPFPLTLDEASTLEVAVRNYAKSTEELAQTLIETGRGGIGWKTVDLAKDLRALQARLIDEFDMEEL